MTFHLLPIIISWSLSLGYVHEMADITGIGKNAAGPSITAIRDENGNQRFSTVSDLYLSASYGKATVYTSFESFQFWMYPERRFNFSPFRAGYTIGGKIDLTENITLDAWHKCEHPVIPDLNGKADYAYNAGQTRFAVTVKGSGTIGGGK